MWCFVLLCTTAFLCVQMSTHTITVNMSDSVEAVDTQQATCQIVTDKLVATASSTVSRALKGVCSTRELEKHFLAIKNELNSQINKVHSMLFKVNQKIDVVQEILNRKPKINSTWKEVPKIQSRDLKIKQNNYTVHEDDVTKKKLFSYYWKIDHVQEKMTKNNEHLVLISPKFYVNGGYRMYLKMLLHQDKGNVYIHVGLTHGENDDELDWPFSLKHRVTIVDQGDMAEDIVSQVWDPTMLCSCSEWQEPSPTKDNEECVGFGFTQDTLTHNSYIHEDSLIIKLDVFI